MSLTTLFLSSTARDVAEYREAVAPAVAGLGDFR